MSLLKLMDEYYALQRSGKSQEAAQRLSLALQITEQRPEALVALGISALEQRHLQYAFIHLAEAYGALAKRGDVAALLAHVLLLKKHALHAYTFLSDATNPARNEPAVRMMRLRALAAQSDISIKQLQEQLPYIQSAEELAFILSKLPRRTWGVIEYDPLSQELQGWVIDTLKPSRTITLTLSDGQKQVKWQATLPSPLLAKSGNSGRLGGIRLRIPDQSRIAVTLDDGTALLGSPVATATPIPLLPASRSDVIDTAQSVVDILIPVYRGKDATLECIHSVLQSRQSNITSFNIIVLDDVSPEPELSQALEVLASEGMIELHRRPANLGFIRNMNRGMLLHTDRDIVWLNADARVCHNWLDRLKATAYSSDDVASVTPFSNNGELMSFPQSRVSHAMPSEEEQRLLDSLAASGPDEELEIEVGCGFCLYIKRQALNEIGVLDELHLKRGYGEETDWCLRAKEKGWRHLGAHRVFVAHRGGVSFGAEKIQRVAFNNAILRQRYPAAESAFDRFYRRDPIKPYRDYLQRSRLSHFAYTIEQCLQSEKPQCAWPVICRADTVERLKSYDQPLPEISLSFSNQGQAVHITLAIRLDGLPLELTYLSPMDNEQLIQDLQALRLPGVIFQDCETCPEVLLKLPERLGIVYHLRCTDDALLNAAKKGSPRWVSFAELAQLIELPFKALKPEHANYYPNVHLTVSKPCHSPRPSLIPIKGKVILIADELVGRSKATVWLNLARALKQQGSDYLFILDRETPWHRELMNCGNVISLPRLPGLNRAEVIQASDCQFTLSLDPSPGCSWLAPHLARLTNLPLFAPKSLAADEVGAYPLHRLGGALGHLLSELQLDRFFHE